MLLDLFKPLNYSPFWLRLMFKHLGISYSPGRLCHLFTAKSLLAVTVMTAGVAKPGWVLAATWVTGEFEGNFRTMMTSCWAWSVNINGLCRRRYCWVDRQDPSKQGEDKEREDTEEKRKMMLKQAASWSVVFRKVCTTVYDWLALPMHIALACPHLHPQHWGLNLGPPTC